MRSPHRITIQQWRSDEGLLDEAAYDARLSEIAFDSVAPAMCDEGCEVEPDGCCEHGCPSIWLALGVI